MSTYSHSEDAITKDEIAGTAVAPLANAGASKEQPKRNVFSELMAPKPKAPKTMAKRSFNNRDGLGAYADNPRNWPTGRVIYHNGGFVAINDLYPKSTVHTLLLPRSTRSLMHPFDAFEDSDLLARVQAETRELKNLVAKELQKKYGKFSEADKKREAVLNGDMEWEEEDLPKGRDWERELLVGIHAHPSMNDLHVHVLSRDMISDCMRHRKHYNSFNTPFLVDVADFPLAKDDPRRHEHYLDRDLICWRCGQNFGNKFKELKAHLKLEFEEWKKE